MLWLVFMGAAQGLASNSTRVNPSLNLSSTFDPGINNNVTGDPNAFTRILARIIPTSATSCPALSNAGKVYQPAWDGGITFGAQGLSIMYIMCRDINLTSCFTLNLLLPPRRTVNIFLMRTSIVSLRSVVNTCFDFRLLI